MMKIQFYSDVAMGTFEEEAPYQFDVKFTFVHSARMALLENEDFNKIAGELRPYVAGLGGRIAPYR